MTLKVRIGNMHVTADGRLSKASADVDGEPLWFESGDVQLRATPEAFGCAVLPAAAAHRADLEIDAPVDARWNANVQALRDVWRQWWRYRAARVHSRGQESSDTTRANGTALCFSAGVDSFYSLLHAPFAFDYLVFAHGYDIKVDDAARAAMAERSLREVAAAVGAKAVVIRTNLREHPAFHMTSWGRTHGGALAAIGHLLSGVVGTLMISSSNPYCHDRPWGSHWKTDSLWSSSRLQIEHFGAELWRTEKLLAISGAELVRTHLRVCWENRSPEANCSCCEKCLRTMLVLTSTGELKDFPVFDGTVDLVERINDLRGVGPDLMLLYEDLIRRNAAPEIKAALRALLARSPLQTAQSMTPGRRFVRRIVGGTCRRLHTILGK